MAESVSDHDEIVGVVQVYVDGMRRTVNHNHQGDN